ncbi:unnamed protein product [Peniophora sp. CBMAI 1063]|nr:unnamed protein product [Peniophora sp. CBMAI 1063]
MSSVSSFSSEEQEFDVSETDRMSVASQESTPARMLRHEKYYFEEVNVKLVVDNVRYNIPRMLLTRHSAWFRERFAQPANCLPPGWTIHTMEDGMKVYANHSLGRIQRERPYEKSPENVYRLYGASKEEFDAMLAVLLPDDLAEHDLNEGQWAAVLKLATLWDFSTVKALAHRHLATLCPGAPLERLIFGRTHGLDDLANCALRELVERDEPLQEDETMRLAIPDVARISKGRELRFRATLDRFSQEFERLGLPVPRLGGDPGQNIETPFWMNMEMPGWDWGDKNQREDGEDRSSRIGVSDSARTSGTTPARDGERASNSETETVVRERGPRGEHKSEQLAVVEEAKETAEDEELAQLETLECLSEETRRVIRHICR